MTPRTWAEQKVEKYQCGMCRGLVHEEAAAMLIEQEHARAVRIVKREIAATELLLASAGRIGNEAREIVYADTLVSLKKVLAALQQGRGTKERKIR